MPVPEAGCWLWLGSTGRGGYGRIRVGGNRTARTHRLAWELNRGPIPDGLHVLHKCDTPCCINPDHLFLGTPLDNAHDRDRKGRQVAGRVGSKYPRPHTKRLTPDNEAWAVWLASMNCSQADIARHFGVSQGTVSHTIVRQLAKFGSRS
jgi:hypothetical protein